MRQASETVRCQAIINDATVPGQDCVITTDDIDAEHPLWNSTHDWEVPRSARNLADCMRPLIRVAKQISIVDPFFDLRPRRGRYVDTLQEILRDLENSPKRQIQFEIHYRTDDRRPPGAVRQIRTGLCKDNMTVLYAAAKLAPLSESSGAVELEVGA